MTQALTRKRPGLERVLKTADRLFYEEGIHATGVDRIAAEAHVSKATLYTYFRTKDDLVTDYLHRRSRSWREYVAGELPEHGASPEERLLAIFDLLGEWFLSPSYRGCPFINSEAECAPGPSSEAHLANLEHRSWVHTLFGGLLKEAGVAEPEAIARQLMLLYDGSMSGAQADPSVDWAAAAREAAESILRNHQTSH
ncbi:AcrR family transcriptional regulator [Arthrobacter sp. CAN_A214]|uniref:TetR/AcrR family transcriptional regulator n=1 Tax=Arthrobacter sp. CAN_A214 TaxID=2787720 RepID=UPI0018CB6D40